MRAPSKVAASTVRSRAVSWLIGLVGISIVVGTLAADMLTGGKLQFGRAELTGCVFGAAIFASGFLLSTGSERLRWGTALCLAASSLTLSLIWPAAVPTLVLLGYVAAGCILLPLRFGALTLLGVGGLHVLLTSISRLKISLMGGLPLTVLDIRLALANPSGLWDALGWPHWMGYLAASAIVTAILGWFVAGLLTAGRLLARRSEIRVSDAVARTVVIGFCGLMILSYLETVYADAASAGSTWHPSGVRRMAARIGTLPFLAYSYHIESTSIGDIYKSDDTSLPPSAEEIRAAVLNYMDFEHSNGSTSGLLPNILVVLAESTFDPGAVFRLQGIYDDELFRPSGQTVANALLRVNAVGGGTWITEFETIVGLDSRLFGYSGIYTHASLSPFVDHSLATYLREYGYHTWAFFPHDGNFYNARKAYEHYGFEKIFDIRDLGKESWAENDFELATTVQGILGREPDSPFFGYVIFIENHAPHRCDVPDAGSFVVRFADSTDFAPNCALHEYVRRLGSTTAAVRSLTDYLADIEARTGRPFAIMVFGDHQPHTFASTGATEYDYSALRKLQDTHTTFFHITSSVREKRLRCCSTAAPVIVLPTLLSGLVARSPDDIYLGINLWLYGRCDSNVGPPDLGGTLGRLADQPRDERTVECKHAYDRALAWYRSSGIIRLRGASGS